LWGQRIGVQLARSWQANFGVKRCRINGWCEILQPNALPLSCRGTRNVGPRFYCTTQAACSLRGPRKMASLRQVRVARGHVIAAGMKDQRLALPPFVLFYFREDNHVIATVEFPRLAAHEVRRRPLQ
jgi:hypothetical protein